MLFHTYVFRHNGLLTKKGTRVKSTNYFADHTNRAGHDLCFPVHDLSLESSTSGKDLLPSVMDLLGEQFKPSGRALKDKQKIQDKTLVKLKIVIYDYPSRFSCKLR